MRRFASLGSLLFILSLAGCGAPEVDNHPLVGKPAPQFKSQLLDNSPFELQQHLGKDVIILDFWATWCGPCRQSLPTLVEVAGEFKNRGVKFFAIDLGEGPDEIQRFLEDSRLDLTVVMDPDGLAGKKYLVEGIPQTVIIGRDGTVRNVHIGSSPGLKSWLTGKLNALVTEQTIAAR